MADVQHTCQGWGWLTKQNTINNWNQRRYCEEEKGREEGKRRKTRWTVPENHLPFLGSFLFKFEYTLLPHRLKEEEGQSQGWSSRTKSCGGRAKGRKQSRWGREGGGRKSGREGDRDPSPCSHPSFSLSSVSWKWEIAAKTTDIILYDDISFMVRNLDYSPVVILEYLVLTNSYQYYTSYYAILYCTILYYIILLF